MIHPNSKVLFKSFKIFKSQSKLIIAFLRITEEDVLEKVKQILQKSTTLSFEFNKLLPKSFKYVSNY